MRSIRLFTTPTVEGIPIEAYLGLVTANQVAGTGFLTDFTASFSDFFGGNSGAYRNEMNRLYSDVIENISQQAFALGGNAVVGVRVDFDNISAKNMSMFMVSIQGTAVKLREMENREEAPSGIVNMDDLECEYNKRVFERKLNNGDYLTKEEWQYVLAHHVPELSEPLYLSYVQACSGYAEETGEETRRNFPIYVSKLSYEQAVSLMYGKEQCYTRIIKDLYLFNAKKILEYAQTNEDFDVMCRLLKTDKPTYNKKDLSEMQELVNFLQNMPDTGKIEEVKGSLFSSGGVKFICQCGEKNGKDEKFCSQCGRDIKGLTMEQREIVDRFVERVSILREILEKK
ncbi:MAG: heavy metal-binding domain-containing protein [Bacteroidaceae bacterium]|nr:heavy metal-binding domain-containing protein [Bacteroidaceae bacterium]